MTDQRMNFLLIEITILKKIVSLRKLILIIPIDCI